MVPVRERELKRFDRSKTEMGSFLMKEKTR